MLARLLRRLILVQVLLGAGLGALAHLWGGSPPWVIVSVAVVLPLVTALLVVFYTAFISRANEGTAAWWRALLGEAVATVRLFVLHQPWTVAHPVWRPATGGTPGIPVVLVHGYVCNYRMWDAVSDTLRAQGHAVFAVNLEPVFSSIEHYAAIVEAAVEDLCAQTGATQVALVGHSMGGLAIRAWMRKHGTARVARVITLGTPHVGTLADPKPFTPNSRQMARTSQWLTELAASELAETRALMRIAISPQDNIVFPQRAQTLEGLEPVVFNGIGHLQMCLHRPVINWVAKEIRTVPLSLRQPPAATVS